MPGGGLVLSPLDSPRNGNISELVHKVAQVYKRRLDNGKPREQGAMAHSEDSHSVNDGLTSDASSGIATPSREGDDVEVDGQKGQPSPLSDPSVLSVRAQMMETVISNMFTTVSSLKNAYMQLQAAHDPFDPEKLQIADKAVIAELKRLSEWKHYYRERRAAITSVQSQDQPDLAEEQRKEAIIKSYEGIISTSQIEMQKKNAELESLRQKLSQTMLKKEKLERRVRRLEHKSARDSCVDIPSNVSPTPQLLESTVLAVSEAVRSFTKLLISLMKSAQWDLDAASNSIEPDISYTRRSHKRYAFESFVCHRMLNGFEDANFCTTGTSSAVLDLQKHRQECFREFQAMKTVDAFEFISTNQGCLFGNFCCKTFLQVIHPRMEESFFGNLEHRNQVTSGCHPHSHFYQTFLRVAKAFWLLHRLAFSFDSTASIFQVRRGTDFVPLYMESVVQNLEEEDSDHAFKPKVGFTVIPGFRVGKAIIKCQVYVTEAKTER